MNALFVSFAKPHMTKTLRVFFFFRRSIYVKLVAIDTIDPHFAQRGNLVLVCSFLWRGWFDNTRTDRRDAFRERMASVEKRQPYWSPLGNRRTVLRHYDSVRRLSLCP